MVVDSIMNEAVLERQYVVPVFSVTDRIFFEMIEKN